MTGTVPFASSLLHKGRQLLAVGQFHAASRLLSRLATFRNLSADIAESVHFHLAEAHLAGGFLKKARRHLAAALALRPDHAQYHFLLAGAMADDGDCDLRQALRHYQRAAELAPDIPEYLCAWGALALEMADEATGLQVLRRAGLLAQDDPNVMGQVVRSLRLAEVPEEAGALLQAGRFRNPRDKRWQALWLEHQFEISRRQQQEKRTSSKKRALLAFPISPVTKRVYSSDKKYCRHDLPSGISGPKSVPRRLLPKQ